MGYLLLEVPKQRGGSDPVFCLTPNLVFAPVLASVGLPSCPEFFFFFEISQQTCTKLNHDNCVPTRSPFIVEQNLSVTLLFSILRPVVQIQAGSGKPHKLLKNIQRKKRGARGQAGTETASNILQLSDCAVKPFTQQTGFCSSTACWFLVSL